MNPRTAQYLPGVVLQDFEWGGSESQVPHLDDGHAVVLRGQHQLGGHLRVPQHSGTVHLEQANRRQCKRQQSICVPQYRLEGRDHVRPWDIRWTDAFASTTVCVVNIIVYMLVDVLCVLPEDSTRGCARALKTV